ncbi:TIGR03560 family F420-dependent LLM class oxidoreductase [Natronolimnobius sp. AArcel1]|uniref:TIGR03560 family F420-dependent LLM class oxidoreductase n=1 Tax=Natronolimnobius sp. AArcel1 TaxID=1679093 RepID=UPI0013EBC92C|nr:TIGR03560 family F420-dependent LLM class oxidoreductase [Natronolimnobius sp. AArcel1]NGM70180.1 TIGR03560 family F420-dependent LLM class oxidoreductase [Natronolimnobius sp. AArcel1]
MEFGYHHSSFATHDDRSPAAALIDRAQRLEDDGFTWLSLMDHLWQLPFHGHRDEPFVECYSGLSAVAAATDEITLSALVTCVHYRNPVYLAKVVSSLDALSEGRAVLGIGAGWYEDEYDAMDMEFPPADERIRQLRDAIKLCETVWTEESPVSYEGEYYDVDDLYLNPKPDDVPILVGGGGEQLTLRLTAEYADWWNLPGVTPEQYEHKLSVLREHCENAGRDYDEIDTTVTIPTIIRDDTDDAHAVYEDLLEETDEDTTPRDEFRGLIGTAEEVAAGIEEYQALNVDRFQIGVPKNDPETIDRFVDDVMGEF